MLAVSAALLALTLRTPLNPYDEGLALVGGVRVLRGEVPFRDFHAVYPPGQNYLLAAAFRAAGTTVGVERLVDAAVRLLLALIVFGLSRALLGSQRAAAGVAIVTALGLASAGFFGYATFPAFTCLLAGTLAWWQFERGGGCGWLVASGAFAGLALTFGLDFGVLALASTVSGLVFGRRAGLRSAAAPTVTAACGWLAAGWLLVSVPFWAALAAQAGTTPVIEGAHRTHRQVPRDAVVVLPLARTKP